MPRYTAVLDACVLVPIALADTLLRVAEKGLYRPLWSGRILAEAQAATEEIHKGGHHRVVPAADRFFAELACYLHEERPPAAATDRVFTALKGPRRGQPQSTEGLDEILDGARQRAGLEHATCHELRHTCLTRLREAGMALEAVQAQAGHLSIESTGSCARTAFLQIIVVD